MAAVHQVRRLVVPAALATTLAAAMLSGAATAGASPAGSTGALPQPSWTASFRAPSSGSPLVRLDAALDLPSAAVRRSALVAADVAEHRVQVKASVARRTVVKRSAAKADKAGSVKPASSSKGAQRASSGHTSGSSGGGSALENAVARIPGYGAHRPANWVSTGRYGHYGATDLASNNVYINPAVPSSKLDSVVRHEWSHILSVRVYGGSYSAMMAATNRVFGGSGMTGAERAADCMAIQLGATWTNYTSCSSAQWRSAAGELLSGRRL
ncbi:hypothetical protein ACPPVT_22110 [Angustibacter sp. McL0619]|uniref:hypothetical protein n=1 Tax=Angustibacter sp. McL0619 TaxID=3415676 RepID=UPI003CEE1DCB